MTPQQLIETGVCPCGGKFEFEKDRLRCRKCGFKVLLNDRT